MRNDGAYTRANGVDLSAHPSHHLQRHAHSLWTWASVKPTNRKQRDNNTTRSGVLRERARSQLESVFERNGQEFHLIFRGFLTQLTDTIPQVWAERDGALFQQAKLALGYGGTSVSYRGEGIDATVDGGAFRWDTDGCAHNAEFVRIH